MKFLSSEVVLYLFTNLPSDFTWKIANLIYRTSYRKGYLKYDFLFIALFFERIQRFKYIQKFNKFSFVRKSRPSKNILEAENILEKMRIKVDQKN